MDPLSVTTGILAITGLAASTCAGIAELRALCKSLPGRLHAVNNEVADLELVLSQIALVLQKRSNLPDRKQFDAIPHLLRQARTKLVELDGVVQHLTAVSRNSKVPLLAASAWRKEQPRLQALQDDIRTIKSSLNIMLGTSNSYDMQLQPLC